MVRTTEAEQFEARGTQAEVGEAFQRAASLLGDTWRKLYFRGDARRAERMAMLDGVVEPLFFEIGRQLASGKEQSTGPWSRAQGLLRLAPSRSVGALDEEFELVRLIADGFASKSGAGLTARRRIRTMVEAARLLAQAELLRRLDASSPAPKVAFGGVVVEVFERPATH